MKIDFWKSFEIKIVVIILSVTIALSSSLYVLYYQHQYNLTIDNLKEDARTVHQFAEDVIGEDSFTQLNTIEDESKEIYRTAHRLFDRIRRIANIRYLYTAKQNASGEYIYVLDGLNPTAEDFRHVGDPIEEEIIPDLIRSLNNEVILGDRILDTEWGIVYVTYFPVHDSEGKVIGAIGMEFDCENLYHSFHRSAIFTFIVTVLIALVCTFIAISVLKKVVRKTELVLQKKDEALLAAKEEAIQNSRVKSDFLSRMSHETRTPMNAIMGMAEVADRTNDFGKIKYCISVIKKSSAQLLALVNDILVLSKEGVSAGQNHVHNTNQSDGNPLDAESSSQEVPDFSPICVLLAEDIEINREILISLLENTRINIETAENGKIAVEMFQNAPEKYHLILMDIQMPEMNGYEAAKTIRGLSLPNAGTIPIIAITANAFKEDIEQSLSSGMNDHIAKPIDLAELIRKIAEYSNVAQ
jgi:CheY-like chemotaxis protein